MTTLKQARDTGKLDEFISEREAESNAKGDAKAFDKTVSAMAGKSAKARPASRKARSDD